MKKILLILVAVLALGGAFAGGYVYNEKQYNRSYNQAIEPANTILDGITQGGDELEAAYNSTSPGYRGQVNRDAFITLVTPVLGSTLRSSSMYIGDSDNRISFEVVGKDNKTYTLTIVTQKEGDTVVVQDVSVSENK